MMSEDILQQDHVKEISFRRYKMKVKKAIVQLQNHKKRLLKKYQKIHDDSETEFYSDTDGNQAMNDDTFNLSRNRKRKISSSSSSTASEVPHKMYCSDDISASFHDSDSFDDTEGNHDEDFCQCHFPWHLKYAQNLMTQEDMLFPLIKRLYKGGILDEFIQMMQLLASGVLPVRNTPLLAALDRSNFETVSTTTKMKYHKETMELWQVVRRQCKYSGLLLFSGLKHGGQVARNMCPKSQYNPQTASVNFAVPHWQTLANNEIDVPKYIQPGLIHKSFELLDKKKEYILEFDAKSVSRGLQENDVGDINLWGFETPNLVQSRINLRKEIRDLEKLSNLQNLHQLDVSRLSRILTNVSTRIRDVRYMRRGHHMLKQKLVKMAESHPKTEKRFHRALCSVKGTIYQCDNWIQQALAFNMKLCEVMSNINKSDAHFSTENHVSMGSLSNVKLLNDPDYINPRLNIEMNSHLVKQRTPLWYKLRKKAYITGSSCYRAIGLSTLKEQQNHFREFVLDLNMPPVHPQVQEKLQHGIDNEVCMDNNVYANSVYGACHREIEITRNLVSYHDIFFFR